MNRLEEILRLVERIPPFPKVAQRIIGLLKEQNISARRLAEVIRYDQAIADSLLKICNSPYYGLPRKAASLDEAVMVIGPGALKNMIIISSSALYFKGAAGGYELGQGQLWRHSVATAIMARRLVRQIAGVNAGTAFTAGLLHDIGKRFLSSFVADEFDRIMHLVNKEKFTFVEAERKLLGTDHAQLSGMILKKWRFPPATVKAVTRHHDPDALRQEALTALVALSNVLVVSVGVGVGAEGLATRLKGEALKRFGVTQPVLDLCMADLLIEMRQAKQLFTL